LIFELPPACNIGDFLKTLTWKVINNVSNSVNTIIIILQISQNFQLFQKRIVEIPNITCRW
jgi:hypothetical protein